MAEIFRACAEFEDRFWTYETALEIPELAVGRRIFYVCGGIDYAFTLILNGLVLHR